MGTPCGADIADPHRFKQVFESKVDNIIIIRIKTGCLVAMIYIERYQSRYYTEGAVQWIRVIFFQNNIPKDLLEVAQIDGCTNLNFFAQIVLPISKAIIAVMVLFYAVGHWNSFFNALLYLRDNDLMPLQMVLRRLLVMAQPDPTLAADMREEWTRMVMEVEMLKYALVVVASVPVIALYPFVQKHFVQGVMIGSIKG